MQFHNHLPFKTIDNGPSQKGYSLYLNFVILLFVVASYIEENYITLKFEMAGRGGRAACNLDAWPWEIWVLELPPLPSPKLNLLFLARVSKYGKIAPFSRSYRKEERA